MEGHGMSWKIMEGLKINFIPFQTSAVMLFLRGMLLFWVNEMTHELVLYNYMVEVWWQ